MFFKKGDWIEVSGGNLQAVVYADDDVFVGRAVSVSPGLGPIMTNELKMYSNKPADYEHKYWIRTVPPLESYQKTLVQKL